VLLPPRLDPAVVAGEEHVGDGPAAKVRGSRVVRILEPAAELLREALELARALGERASRATASRSTIAGRSPLERTYGPIEIASLQRCWTIRWSKPSNRADSSVSVSSSASSSTISCVSGRPCGVSATTR
jgi:hypothetical protein